MRDFKDLKIAVAGTGYVGLSIATLLSQHHQVTAVDVVPEKVEKINKLFEKASGKPSEIERRAGIDKLTFGLFGMLDWYALRMGYVDHDEVLRVGWMRIYKCMDMDTKKAEFNKRLQEEIINDNRRKVARGSKK